MQLAQLRVSRLSNVESPHIVMHTHARVVRASKSSYYSNERPLAATHGQTQTAAKKSMPSPTGVRTTIKWETAQTGQRESAECFAVCVCVCVCASLFTKTKMLNKTVSSWIYVVGLYCCPQYIPRGNSSTQERMQAFSMRSTY